MSLARHLEEFLQRQKPRLHVSPLGLAAFVGQLNPQAEDFSLEGFDFPEEEGPGSGAQEVGTDEEVVFKVHSFGVESGRRQCQGG